LGQFLLGDVFTKMAAMAPPALKGARRQRSLGVVLGFNVHVATQEKSIENVAKINTNRKSMDRKLTALSSAQNYVTDVTSFFYLF
jgi:hypothetical protein